MTPKIERQTDKTATKTIQCTYPDCDTQLIVNTFYAPAKGRCSEHRGKPTESIRLLARQQNESADVAEAAPNGALAHLLCPVCSHPLKIIRFPGMFGYIDFGCANSPCGTAVSIKVNWASTLLKSVSPEIAEIVAMYNKLQQERENAMRDASMLGTPSHL